MKKIFYILVLLIATSTKPTFATDIVVEEFGLAPAYASITDAVAAAVDGDRIIIKNRAGNIPWIENITITKSLELLPFDNDTFFIVQGNYTINIAAGKTVSIIGMRNLVGSIIHSSVPTGTKVATLNIFGSWLQSGYIYFNDNGYDLHVVHTKMDDGYIVFVFGEVTGCDITTSATNVSVTASGGGVVLNDTVFIVGNKIQNHSSNGGIILQTNDSRFYVKNNFITHEYMGIRVNEACSGNNYIYNNTILDNTFGTTYGMYVSSSVSSGDVIEIMNNVIDDSNTAASKQGIINGGATGTVNVYYNHIDMSFGTYISPSFTFVGNNTTNATIVLQADGHLQAGSTAINNGNPAAPYYDLDLSVGDPGAYGGSLTLDNFFPLHTGGARVYLTQYPFNVRQGNTLNIKAKSYDR